MTGFLFDENLPGWWPAAVRHHEPHLLIWAIGDGFAPPKQTPDPVILEWCEAQDACLITNNRLSMPEHLASHCSAGRHVPGIFTVRPSLSTVILATSLAYVFGASLPDEHRDRISYLPLIVP